VDQTVARNYSSVFSIKGLVETQLKKISTITVIDLDLPFVFRFEISNCNLLTWLNSQETKPCFYFASRNKKWEIAGLGQYHNQARQGITLQQWHQLIEKHPYAEDLRLFFIRNFSSGEAWSEFSLLQNTLPLVFRERIGEKFYQTHLINPEQFSSSKSLQTYLADCVEGSSAELEDCLVETLPRLKNRKDLPNQDQWIELVHTALQQIENHTIEKVVLARRSDFNFDDNLNPLVLLQALKNINQTVYNFLYSPKVDHSFLGASPERLFSVTKTSIKTEALAGTVNGSSLADNLFSNKNLKEHEFVVKGLCRKLGSIANQIVTDAKPTSLHLADLVHLKTRIQGTLSKEISLNKIIECLHPTAAVCGYPSESSANFIETLEPFARGLYAGPIGIAKKDALECAIALRSCLITPSKISVFAGAGIVAESEAEKEWEELETKISTVFNIFKS